MPRQSDFLHGIVISAACSALPVRKKLPTAYSYNGTILPKLPEWDRSVYPYAYITYFLTYDEYYVWLSPVPIYATIFWGDYILHSNGVQVNALRYLLSEDGKAWEYKGIWGGVLNHTFKPIWCNSDMYLLTEDDAGNTTVTETVALEASEPVPVYE